MPQESIHGQIYLKQTIVGVALSSLIFTAIACRACRPMKSSSVAPPHPKRNILRYVNGDEPESLDPPISSGQPEARIYMALFEGLVEYDPKSLNAIPAMAERWDINNDSSEFVFHLRQNARWSNGDPITAHDFVYSIRAALAPKFASRTADLAYYISMPQAYNAGPCLSATPRTISFSGKGFAGDEPAPGNAEPEDRWTAANGNINLRSSEPSRLPTRLFISSCIRRAAYFPAREKARNKLLARTRSCRRRSRARSL